jgi:hypothetical protein
MRCRSDAGGDGTSMHTLRLATVAERAELTISHGQMGLQILQSFVKTRMSIGRDGMVTFRGFCFVCGAVAFVLHLDLQRSPKRTVFVLRNVEFHHHIAVHRFGVSSCTRRTLNLFPITLGRNLRRRVGVLVPISMQELCAVRRVIPGTVPCKKLRN